MQPQTKIDPDELVKQFNAKYLVGDLVRWRSVGIGSYPYREYTVARPAVNHHGQAVVWFRERSGICSIEPQFVDYK